MPDPAPARHILTFAQTLAGGGVERAQLRLAAGWLAAGRRVTLVVGSAAGPLAGELPEGLETVELGTHSYLGLLRVAGLVRERRPDVLFCPGNHYTGAAAAIRWRLGRAAPPIVGKLSNTLVRRDQPWLVAGGYRAWLRRHPRFLDHLVAMTPAMQREAVALMGMPAERTSVIANPPARPIAGAAAVALPAGRFVLGVGRLRPQKRWDRLIAAFAALGDPALTLVILGEGPMRPALEAQVARLGLTGRVLLPGHALDPLPAIAQAAVVALTSDYEGVPGALAEALAEGTPVVATDCSVAVREIVTSPAQGEVVPVGDAGALVAALRRRLAPGAARPARVVAGGDGAATAYLALFDRVAG